MLRGRKLLLRLSAAKFSAAKAVSSSSTWLYDRQWPNLLRMVQVGRSLSDDELPWREPHASVVSHCHVVHCRSSPEQWMILAGEPSGLVVHGHQMQNPEHHHHPQSTKPRSCTQDMVCRSLHGAAKASQVTCQGYSFEDPLQHGKLHAVTKMTGAPKAQVDYSTHLFMRRVIHHCCCLIVQSVTAAGQPDQQSC